jgi:hypothetical protein
MKKIFTSLYLLFLFIGSANSSELKSYCDQAKKLVAKGIKFEFTKLDKFNFMDGTNLRILEVDHGDYDRKYEFQVKNELGKGLGALNFKNGGGDLKQKLDWTMLNKDTLAVYAENYSGSRYNGQRIFLIIFSLKDKNELSYVFCKTITSSQSEIKKAKYKLKSGITKAEYENSTEGILHRSYVFYQILRKLHKSRESYAIKYVSDEQINEIKEKVKFIEDQAVKKDNINSDEIWKKASETYEKDYAYSVDAVEASGQFVNEGKQLASLAMMDINNSFKEMGGSTAVKKDF